MKLTLSILLVSLSAFAAENIDISVVKNPAAQKVIRYDWFSAFNGGEAALIGSTTSNRFIYTNPPVGVYVLTVKMVNTNGSSPMSGPILLTRETPSQPAIPTETPK